KKRGRCLSKPGPANSGSQKNCDVRWCGRWTKLDKWNAVEGITELPIDKFSFGELRFFGCVGYTDKRRKKLFVKFCFRHHERWNPQRTSRSKHRWYHIK